MDLPYENENYIVNIRESGDGYIVVNKNTKVIEAEHNALPRAVIVADEYNDWLLRQNKKDVERTYEGTVIPLR